jgi:regulator of protease activity HflC (stomatin/prohibitin superfamily)
MYLTLILKFIKKIMKNKIIISVFSLLLLQSCVVVRPGEVGVKQRLGKLSDKITTQGPALYNPFTSKIIKASIQTNDLEQNLSLPSKEGLSVNAQVSILYRLEQERVAKIIETYGLSYENIISNVFRSAAADVSSNFFAKDMHSGRRSNIEAEIKSKMGEVLTKQGIIVESVLMKSIQLPAGLASSVERKLQAEQEAMRMEFVLQQEKLEAERKIIAAQGTRDSQKIISEGLNNDIIRLRSIEAFLELSKSPNAKVIITDGKSPFLIQ